MSNHDALLNTCYGPVSAHVIAKAKEIHADSGR